MPKHFRRLSTGDTIVAFDDKTRKFFTVELRPLSLKSLTDEEILDATKLAHGILEDSVELEET